MEQVKPFPDGHFYSPIIRISDAVDSQERICPRQPQALGIDFNQASHLRWLQEILPAYSAEFEAYPPNQTSETEFYRNNTIFSWMDSRTLFAVLRHFQPKRMVEIGSGMSSLLTADVNCRYLDRNLHFTCVEPYPKPYLLKGIDGISELIQEKVEDTPFSIFEDLRAGDILFIDSSHVSKTGSDVNHIYFEIIPRLAAGVIIHIHDIFLPADYPKPWVLNHGRSWNEQYILQALLMYTYGFEVIFGCAYALYRYPDLLKQLLGGKAYGGGSFWMKKVSDRNRAGCENI